jgi:hypothetical protein
MNWTSFKRLPVLKHNFEPVEKIISEKLDELKDQNHIFFKKYCEVISG